MRMLSWIRQHVHDNPPELNQVWRDYMSLCPDDVDAQESYGWYLLDFHGHQTAFDHFLHCSAGEHRDVFFYNLAQLAYHIADYTAAYVYIEPIAQSLPEDPSVLRLKYDIEAHTDRHEEARETFAQLTRLTAGEARGERGDERGGARGER